MNRYHTKLKDLFKQVQEIESDCWNALRYYRNLDDALARLHLDLDNLILSEELKNEGSKDSGSGSSGTEANEAHGPADSSDAQWKSYEPRGSNGISGLVEERGSKRDTSNQYGITKSDYEQQGYTVSPDVPTNTDGGPGCS